MITAARSNQKIFMNARREEYYHNSIWGMMLRGVPYFDLGFYVITTGEK